MTQEQKDFVTEVKAAVDKYRGSLKIVSPVVAQAVVETGWGRSEVAVNARNLFGITKGSYSGKTYTKGKVIYRAYGSIDECVKDYFKILNSQTRYRKVLKQTCPYMYLKEIHNAGWCEGTEYADYCYNLIRKSGLFYLDDKRSDKEIAQEVLNGRWDNGVRRVQLLSEAGYDAEAVQKVVNSL